MKKLILSLGLVAAILVFLYYTPGLPRSSASPITAVLEADQMRLAAMMKSDGPALERLMSDELRFVHSDGRIETKHDYIKNMLAGDTAYADALTTDLEIRQPSADVVILIGRQEMRKRLGPEWSQIKLHFMSVWRNEGGTWRMYAWESMKPSGSSVVPGK